MKRRKSHDEAFSPHRDFLPAGLQRLKPGCSCRTRRSEEAAAEMPLSGRMLLCLGVVLMVAGGVVALGCGLAQQSAPLFALGLFLGMGGVALLVSGVCMAMRNLQVAVPGHSLLHPRTGTRFSPQQALAIQRRLDRIRREMSEDSVGRDPEPESPLPSTPPPWTMEPPPSYDTVMKEHSEQP